MTQPPGSGTLVDQINELRRRIDELTRSGPASPACRVTLNANPTLGVGDTWAAANWVVTEDPFGWFTSGSPSYITLGLTGYYMLNYHSCTTGAASGQIAASKIAVNAASVTASVASDLAQFSSAGEGAVQDAFRPRVKLNAGDKIYWSNYVSASAQLQATTLNVPTQMSVMFLSSR